MGMPWASHGRGEMQVLTHFFLLTKRGITMFTFINILNAEAFRHRVASVLEVLQGRGVTADAVHAAFLATCENKMAGEDAWERLGRMENPTMGELKLYARVLQVNTTWLLTGDVRFVPELMAGTCLCWEVPERMWTTYGSAVDPATTHQFNPDCPAHGPELVSVRLQPIASEVAPQGWIVPRTAADWGLTPDSVATPAYTEQDF